MNRYAIEPTQKPTLELIALDDGDPPARAFRVHGNIAENYYRARDIWEQAQRSLQMILDGDAPTTEGQREGIEDQNG